LLKQYLEELKKIPLLSREEESRLWERDAAGDGAAHQKLITSYQPLVFKLAMTFRLPEAVTLELIQEGTLGLLEAADSYDYRKGVAFSLFATHRIKGCMYDFLNQEQKARYVSLDVENEFGRTLAESLPSELLGPMELAERHLLSEKVVLAVGRLPEKEKLVLEGLFIENKSIAEMANLIHVSTGHIYRLQEQGVRRVRGMLSKFMREFKKD
jgi:RNA polymerase sigma factor (sigma-70 family)